MGKIDKKEMAADTRHYAYFPIRHYADDNTSVYVPERELNELAVAGWRFVAEQIYGVNNRYFLMERAK